MDKITAEETARERLEGMSTIRIRKKLDSDTLQLPELKPLIGKTVEITVEEAELPKVRQFGTLKGTVLSMEHFDDPLDEFEEYM